MHQPDVRAELKRIKESMTPDSQNLKYVRNIYYLPEIKVKKYTNGIPAVMYIQQKPIRIKDLTNQEIEKVLLNIQKGIVRSSENYTVQELTEYLLLEVKAREQAGRQLIDHFLKTLFPTMNNTRGREAKEVLNLSVDPTLFFKKPKKLTFSTHRIRER